MLSSAPSDSGQQPFAIGTSVPTSLGLSSLRPAEQDEVHVEVVQLRAVRILAAATRLVTATEVRTVTLFGAPCLGDAGWAGSTAQNLFFSSDASLCHGRDQYPDAFLL